MRLETGPETGQGDHLDEEEMNMKPMKRQRNVLDRPPPSPTLQQTVTHDDGNVVVDAVVASRQHNKVTFASLDIREKQRKGKKTQSQEPGTSGRLPGTRKLGEVSLQSQKRCMTSWLTGSPRSTRARPETQMMPETTSQTSPSKDNKGFQSAAPTLATNESSTENNGPENGGGG